MEYILVLIYVLVSYWAVGATIYRDKVRIGTLSDLFLTRLIIGCILGWILIPVALVGCIFRFFKR